MSSLSLSFCFFMQNNIKFIIFVVVRITIFSKSAIHILFLVTTKIQGELLMWSSCGFYDKMRIFKKAEVLLQQHCIMCFSTYRYNSQRSFNFARKIKKESQKFYVAHMEYPRKKLRNVRTFLQFPDYILLLKFPGSFPWDTTAFNVGSTLVPLNFSRVDFAEWK